VKSIASGKLTQVASRYAEHAPATTACCMSCRTCVTTNLLTLAAVPVVLAAGAVRRLFR
jgi:hypothetical protein